MDRDGCDSDQTFIPQRQGKARGWGPGFGIPRRTVSLSPGPRRESDEADSVELSCSTGFSARRLEPRYHQISRRTSRTDECPLSFRRNCRGCSKPPDSAWKSVTVNSRANLSSLRVRARFVSVLPWRRAGMAGRTDPNPQFSRTSCNVRFLPSKPLGMTRSVRARAKPARSEVEGGAAPHLIIIPIDIDPNLYRSIYPSA
jgi:hypothetical protein